MNGLTVRPMADADVDAVVGLLGESLGPGPGGVDRRELFVWKHLQNPFGRSIALLAEDEAGSLAGLRAFMRWSLTVPGGGTVAAVRAVDTATSPAFQRRGLFTRLTTEALAACEAAGVRVVFNTPNEKSLPGYLKLGWRRVARWPVHVRVRRPVAFGRRMLRGDRAAGGPLPVPAGSGLRPAAEALATPEAERALARAARPRAALATPRTPAYLRWRYGAGPMPYHVLLDDDALVILRLRERGPLAEAVVAEVLAADRGAARRALARAVRATGADHAVAHFGTEWPAAAALSRTGFVPMPGQGMTFVVRPLGGREGLDPFGRGSWSLTLGDLEVF